MSCTIIHPLVILVPCENVLHFGKYRTTISTRDDLGLSLHGRGEFFTRFLHD